MNVPTFAELLRQYLERSGISDSELARSIGVRRQTVFRWKEGLVERPRARDDVMRCAQKLRLTSEERDLLLLAAGFAPEELSAEALRDSLQADGTDSPTGSAEPVIDKSSSTQASNVTVDRTSNIAALTQADGQALTSVAPALPATQREESIAPISEQRETTVAEEEESTVEQLGAPASMYPKMLTQRISGFLRTDAALPAWRKALLTYPNRRYVALGLMVGLVLIILIFWRTLPAILTPSDPLPSNPVVRVTLNAPNVMTLPPNHPQATPNQTLLLVASFTGYTTNEQYNVAGRISDLLNKEVVAAKLVSTTIASWQQEIQNPAHVQQVLAASNASLLIWGEYDSGRVLVNLDGENITQQQDFPLSAPTELITTITDDVPGQSRILALTALGRLLRQQGDSQRAESAFVRALELQPEDIRTRALLNFYLGHLAEQGGTLADLTQAIDYYSTALDENPRLYDARYNRGTVYLNRSYLHPADDAMIAADLDAAIMDLTTVIRVRRDYLAAVQNRGIARYERNAAGDLLAAVNDFNTLIVEEPENSRAYFHRALVTIRIGENDDWIEDFQQTLALSSAAGDIYYPAYNGLCWGYGLAQEPEIALPHCNEAVAHDPTGASRDSRGIVYAQLGRYEDAIVEFEAYLVWLREMDVPNRYERYRGPVVETWVEELAQGKNPITPAVLEGLR